MVCASIKLIGHAKCSSLLAPLVLGREKRYGSAFSSKHKKTTPARSRRMHLTIMPIVFCTNLLELWREIFPSFFLPNDLHVPRALLQSPMTLHVFCKANSRGLQSRLGFCCWSENAYCVRITYLLLISSLKLRCSMRFKVRSGLAPAVTQDDPVTNPKCFRSYTASCRAGCDAPWLLGKTEIHTKLPGTWTRPPDADSQGLHAHENIPCMTPKPTGASISSGSV